MSASLLIWLLLAPAVLSLVPPLPAIQSGRVQTLAADASSYWVTYLSPVSNPGLVLSLTSFTSSAQLSATASRVNSTGFEVRITAGVTTFSYVVVSVDGDCNVGETEFVFVTPSAFMDAGAVAQTSRHVAGLNIVLLQAGEIEPFLSAITFSRDVRVSESVVEVSANQEELSVTVRTSIDVTRVKISLLVYPKISDRYLQVQPYDEFIRFEYQDSNQPIFIGVRRLKIIRSQSNSFGASMLTSIAIQTINVDMEPLVLVPKQIAPCPGGLYDTRTRANLSNCIPASQILSCPGPSRRFFNSLSVCTRSDSPIPSINSSSTPINITHTVSDPTFCLAFANRQSYLECTTCNSGNQMMEWRGSCACRPGYWTRQGAPCQKCGAECGFEIELRVEVKTVQENATEQIEAHFSVNRGRTDVTPSLGYAYSDLKFDILLNGSAVSYSINWLSSKQATITLSNYPIRRSYSLTLSVLNTLLMSRKDGGLFLSPSLSQEVSVEKPQPSQLFSQSISTISNVVPTASLVTALMGSKFNLFSLVQASSVFYLSSLVKWEGFGSINRVQFTQSVFELQPTNFFTSIGVSVPLPKIYSDDSSEGNPALTHYSNEMYISIIPEFVISLLVQIVIMQVLVQVLSRLFRPPHRLVTHKIDVNRVTWVKKPFLMEIIQSEDRPLTETLALTIEQTKVNRFIFYSSTINSQLVYHCFMIFSQFRINVSTLPQVFNFLSTVAVLGVLVALPCIGPYQPLTLLKSIAVVFKKRPYTTQQLQLFYLLSVLELAMIGASIAVFEHSLHQCVGVVVVIAVRLVLMARQIKYIEFVKYVCLGGYFVVLGVGTYFDNATKSTLETISIGLIMAVSGIELLKIVKSVIVAVLGAMKEPPSIKGRAIIHRIQQYKNK